MAVTPNYYETLYIARPDIQEEDLAKIQQKLQDSISAHQGDIIKAEKWAERGLAYEIQDHKRGIYYILLFKALPSACAEIEKHLSFYNTDILRFITLKITEEAVNKQKAAEKAEAQKAESAKEAAAEVAEEVAQEVVPEAQKAESTEEAAAEVVEEVAQEVVPETQQAESAEEPVAEAAEEVAQEVVPETQQAESAEEPAAEVTEEEGGTK